MTYPRSREGSAPTVPLEDVALSDRESVFHAPRAGDVALLGVLVAVLMGNGVWIWRQLGADSHAGRAVFFGMALLSAYWCALVYIFKLSLAVRVSPRSISVARGPWQVEIRWSELTRLMERMQTLDGRRYRWVIALARDGRRISIREDAIGDYARFRREMYERYRVWRDHGGTWGATGSGPFVAREVVGDEALWWFVAALMILAPGLYFTMLLPETNPLGYLLLAASAGCLAMVVRAFLQRQTYTVERQYIEARSALKRARLTWSEVTKVERSRRSIGGVVLSGVALGRLLLRLASRGDASIRTFAWSPRTPEYLTLRGGGRQTRVRLHRLMQPDELLAWIEFYDQVRRSATTGPRSRPLSDPLTSPKARATSAPTVAAATAGVTSGPVSAPLDTPDLSDASGPLDPWGAGRQGEPSQPTMPRTLKTPFVARTPTTPRMPDLPDTAMPWQESEPSVVDAAPPRTPATSHDDAWLRDTNARLSVNADRWQPPAEAQDEQEQQEQQEQQRAAWQASPSPMPAPEMPQIHPIYEQPVYEQPRAAAPTPRWDAAPPAEDPEPDDMLYPDEEEAPTSDMEAAPAPWHEAGWQPPILPRFGPQRDDDPSQR